MTWPMVGREQRAVKAEERQGEWSLQVQDLAAFMAVLALPLVSAPIHFGAFTS